MAAVTAVSRGTITREIRNPFFNNPFLPHINIPKVPGAAQ